MTKYQQFLNSAEIISEDLFNDVINSLPECDIESISFDDTMCLDSQDYIAECIISEILDNWKYAFAEDVDFENKTFSLCDVDSLEDLEEIKNTFDKWTISNYDELYEEIVNDQEENNEYENKMTLFKSYMDDISYEDLKKFLNNYDKK